MTEVPPPPPGSYPPPPQGGYPPPPPQPYNAAPADNPYTPWVTRVLAFLIDYVPYLIMVGIGYAIELFTQETVCTDGVPEYQIDPICVTGNSPMGVAALFIFTGVGLAYIVWNYGYKQGTTGSSIGKSIMKFKVVSEATGQPIGFGMSIVRQLAHFVDAIICYIGFLFPLWDAKRQTIADKLIKTVCLPV